MKVIKKTVERVMTTGNTENCKIEDNCFIIIPDTSIIYNFKILLTSNTIDLGFFDVINEDVIELVDDDI